MTETESTYHKLICDRIKSLDKSVEEITRIKDPRGYELLHKKMMVRRDLGKNLIAIDTPEAQLEYPTDEKLSTIAFALQQANAITFDSPSIDVKQ